MTLLATSTRDLKLTRTYDPVTQVCIIDVPRTGRGDVASVAGPNRLVQRVTDWLQTPRGSYAFDPTYGNPLLAQLLRPTASDPAIYSAMVSAAEDDFLARQRLAAAQGYLSVDEQVDHFSAPTVTYGQNDANGPIGTITVTFNIVTRAGTALPASANFSATFA